MKKNIFAIIVLLAVNSTLSLAQQPTAEQLEMLKSAGIESSNQPKDLIEDNTSYERSYAKSTTPPQKKITQKTFGAEIFSSPQLSFAPALNIPTPRSYIIAAGDNIHIIVWGSAEAEYNLEVSPDGDIAIPRIGVVHIGGLSFEVAEKLIEQKLSGFFTGLDSGTVECKVTLGDIRSISVNIVGEASTPGTYTLPSLSTLFNAIYSAGGVSPIGSLRSIRLYRGGELLSTLDIYDYLESGNSNLDLRLEDNDLIVVEPTEVIVHIEGSVRRAMDYELLRGETIANLIEYAGGFIGNAYKENINVVRSDSQSDQQTLHSVPQKEFSDFTLLDGDSVIVGEKSPRFKNRVTIEGAVWRAGQYELSDSLTTVDELITLADGVLESAYMGRAQIVRTAPDLSLHIIPFSLIDVLENTTPAITLQRDDIVRIFSTDELSEELHIKVLGEVNNPNTFDYAVGMTLGDAILLARGFRESAALSRVELARRQNNPYDTVATPQRAELFSFWVTDDLSLNQKDKDFIIEPFDEIYIRRSPSYREQQVVSITGEVNFAGDYAMQTATDRLTDLIEAAGGLSLYAYTKGASLSRQYTQADVVRQKSLEHVTLMMQDERKRNQGDNQGTTLSEYHKITVGEYYNIGIDLAEAIAEPKGSSNLQLQSGDRLLIPTLNNIVSVVGAVYLPTTMSYKERLTVREYIKRAGGYSSNARRHPFIIEANGRVMEAKGTMRLTPGSQIVVPYKPYREPLSTQSWIGISTSIVSMAAMVMSLL